MDKDKKTQFKEYINSLDLPNTSIVFENPDYFSAIIGIDFNTGSVIYDYNKMIEFLVETEEMSEVDAVDFIEYNTIRSIPYWADGAKPTICYSVDDYI